MEVYYYVPASEASYAVECGLKLSRWHDREVVIGGAVKKCLAALLNPKDDMDKYKSPDLKCLKLEVSANYCYIADRYLYELGKDNPLLADMYTTTIRPASGYIFGSFRLPECLVASTVIGGYIKVLDRRIDSPVLFENSEELYLNNIIETRKEMHNDFGDAMLYYFFCRLAESGKIDKIEDVKRGVAVFMDKRDGKYYTLKVPDIEKY